MYHMTVTDMDNGLCFEATGHRELVMDALIHLFPKIRLIGQDLNRWAYATSYHNVLIIRDINDPQYKKEDANEQSTTQ